MKANLQPSPKLHCQICFHDVPGHYDNCPVATGQSVEGNRPHQEVMDEACARLAQHLAQASAQNLTSSIGIPQAGISLNVGLLSLLI